MTSMAGLEGKKLLVKRPSQQGLYGLSRFKTYLGSTALIHRKFLALRIVELLAMLTGESDISVTRLAFVGESL